MKHVPLFCALLLILTVQIVWGQIPQKMSYQGMLTDINGNPVNEGSYQFTFKMYDDTTGGNLLWTETQTVDIDSGLYHVVLGTVTPLDLSFDKSYWLGVTVEEGSELSPRIELTASPYSLNARSVLGSSNVFPSAGNVGIGTLSPNSMLEVAGTIHSTIDGFKFPDGTVQTTAATESGSDGDWTVSGNNMYAAVTGNVGIGTTSPQRILHIADPNYVSLVLEDAGALTDQKKKFINSDDGLLRFGTFSDDWAFNAQMTIDDSGNVGIGTTDPSYTLHVLNSLTNNDPAIYGIHRYYYLGMMKNYGTGVKGVGGAVGVEGDGWVPSGSDAGSCIGVLGNAVKSYGQLEGTLVGVKGQTSGSAWWCYGVYGAAGGGMLENYAGYFAGNLHVTGTITKGAGGFKIDHPLDPENKYLYHSFVESPDMMNIYNGNVILDTNGEATVEMPEWFESLNRDFRYQITPIGAPGPNLYIAEKINGNRFKISGGTSGMEVSWQVTGVRKDAYAEAHRIPVEEEKNIVEQGTYLYPTEFGMPESMGKDTYIESRMMNNTTY